MENLDLYTDEQLDALRHTVIARQTRIRGLVLAGRVPRATLDALTSEADAVDAEIARRAAEQSALG